MITVYWCVKLIVQVTGFWITCVSERMLGKKKSKVSLWKLFVLSNDFKFPFLITSTKPLWQNAKPVWIKLLNFFCLSCVSCYQAMLNFTSADFNLFAQRQTWSKISKLKYAGDIFYLPRRGRKTLACSITSVFLSFISQQSGLETLYLGAEG